MVRNNLLYICFNDGSDMRISKEIKSLSQEHRIYFLGTGSKSESSFSSTYCDQFYLINGRHKSPITILKMLAKLLFLLQKFKIKNIHVVDEQLYILLIPILFRKKVTLDIFDSIFLKLNKPNEKLFCLKKIIYSSVKNIIVTDENRKNLLPNFAKSKAVIIPNVPFSSIYESKISDNKFLTICYFGTLLKDRGSDFINKLLENSTNIRIIAAGWIGDDFTKNLIRNPKIDYLGIRSQTEINNILATLGDYLLAIYPYNNLNNINASPNKIYDSIHTKTPIIINEEIIVSEFVRKRKLGYIVNTRKKIDYTYLSKILEDRKNSYHFSDDLISQYCWENYEKKLLKIYR